MYYFNEVYQVLNKRVRMDAITTQSLTHMVLVYMRHEAAHLLYDAWKKDKLFLKYVRRYMIRNSLINKDDIYENLAPSVCHSTVYGDEDSPMSIIRTHISLRERVRTLKNVGTK